MSQKENRLFILSYLVSVVIALLVNKQAIYVLVFIFQIAMIFSFYNTRRNKVVEIEEKSNLEADKANERADETFILLTKLIEAIPSPLVYINQRGDFEVSNQYFQKLTKSDQNNVYDVLIDSPLRQTLLDAFLNEKQFVRQFTYENTDFQVLSIPLFNEKRYVGCMLIFQDVTRVVEGEKMQKRFIADASHELRTPITAIKGMIEILNRDRYDDLATAKEFGVQIEKETNKLEQIVDDLLLQSRLKSNKVYLELSNFNLKQFFDGLIYEKRQELHKNNIEVVLNCPSDINLTADHFRLSQVVLNLLNNAINYSKDGQIMIQCSSRKNNVKIKLVDTGSGIKSGDLPHIFERFFKGSPDTSKQRTGSGLGLAISKSIIEAHGGSIMVDSVEGEGTTFTIELENKR